MASNLRELRERRNSVATTKKITRAMELIASSRIIKAQSAVKAASPYSLELTRALSAVAAHTHEDHPLTSINPDPKRSAVLVITSDRGLAGAYSSNAIRTAEELTTTLQPKQEIATYLCGRKAVQYFEFRGARSTIYGAVSLIRRPTEMPRISQTVLLMIFCDRLRRAVSTRSTWFIPSSNQC